MNRIMLDLETMGNGSNAAIVSVGAVRFDIDEGITDTFEIGIDLASSVAQGGVMDASTVMWWLGRNEGARQKLLSAPTTDTTSALLAFSSWAWKDATVIVDEVWGCGATADNVWLSNAYRRAGVIAPWTYKADRCYRTMRELFPFVPKPPFVGVEHYALDDARNQALHLIEILKHIRQSQTREAPASNLGPEKHA